MKTVNDGNDLRGNKGVGRASLGQRSQLNYGPSQAQPPCALGVLSRHEEGGTVMHNCFDLAPAEVSPMPEASW